MADHNAENQRIAIALLLEIAHSSRLNENVHSKKFMP
jgi:hypothetical protein